MSAPVKVEVAAEPMADIARGPLQAALSIYAEGLRGAILVAAEFGRASGEPDNRIAGALAAFALRHAAWSILSAHGDTSKFDPAAFGQAAERIARETLPDFIQQNEARGATRQ